LTSGYVAYGNGSGLTGSGNLTFNGITLDITSYLRFPSGGNSLLGAYEEGTWNPQFLAYYGDSVSATYSHSQASNYYRRIGSVVFIVLNFSYNNFSWSGSNWWPTISLPYNPGYYYYGISTVDYLYNFPNQNSGSTIVKYTADISGGSAPGLSLTYYTQESSNGAVFGRSLWPTYGTIRLIAQYFLNV
jgi:hypothetical protein